MQYKARKSKKKNPKILFLEGYLDLESEVRSLTKKREMLLDQKERYDQAFERATKATSNLTALRVSGTSDHDNMANAVCDMIKYQDYAKSTQDLGALDAVILKKIYDLAECLRVRLNAIGDVSDASMRRILIHRYIDGYSWEYISHIMGYEMTWIYHMHGEALKNVQFHVKNAIKTKERS